MDPFALLGLPRRPLLPEDRIGSAYRSLAGEAHPDRGGDAARFAELGRAEAILSDPASRLRELSGIRSGKQPPPRATEFFPRIAQLLQRADQLAERHSEASSPLAKALLMAPAKSLSQELDSMLRELAGWRDDLERELERADAVWPSHEPAGIAQLADSYAFLGRWESQLREKRLTLDCLGVA